LPPIFIFIIFLSSSWREALHALDLAAACKEDTDAAAADAVANAPTDVDTTSSSSNGASPTRRIGRLERALARKKITKDGQEEGKISAVPLAAAASDNAPATTPANASSNGAVATGIATRTTTATTVPARPSDRSSLECAVHSSAAAACLKGGQPLAALQVGGTHM